MPEPTIIVRREAEDDHDAHHGGGWKVAYADFMTAMMAFFLMLWILNAADEEKLEGLARYFTPVLSYSSGGGPDVLDGISLEAKAALVGGSSGEADDTTLPTFGQEQALAIFDSRLRYEAEPDIVVEYADAPEPATIPGTIGEVGPADAEITEASAAAAEAEAEEAARAEATLKRVQEEIQAGIAATAGGRELSEHLRISRTEEGLEVQITDLPGGPMFELGSARIEERTQALIEIIGEAIAELPNRVIIAGHTDAVPFARLEHYDNWDLSTERAHATRRALIGQGIDEARILRVSGFADTRPLLPDTPDAPENRRISVLLVSD